jgi:hypothetical protein
MRIKYTINRDTVQNGDIDKRVTVLIVPGDVRRIGYSALGDCSKLVRVTHSARLFGDYAFKNCTKLESIYLPPGMRTIGYGAFLNCRSLRSLVIPSNVTFLGARFIDGCTGLDRIWNKSKCKMIEAVLPWCCIQGVPTTAQLEKWTFALHWHWRYPGRISPNQVRRFTIGIYCLAVPIELCQFVFSYIPRA